MESNWAWGLALVVLTVVIHATGLALLAVAIQSIRHRLEIWGRVRFHELFTIMIGVIGAIGLLLAALHGIEAALWAVAYWWLGALDSPADALFYSVDSITTRGASGLTLTRHWRMMGAVEAMDGILLFGISTAFMYAVMHDYWPIITRRVRH